LALDTCPTTATVNAPRPLFYQCGNHRAPKKFYVFNSNVYFYFYFCILDFQSKNDCINFLDFSKIWHHLARNSGAKAGAPKPPFY